MQKHYLIGTDEAGYGPNLGPLTVTGTLWQVPDVAVDLYQTLQAMVTPTAVRGSRAGTKKLHLADSKAVYSSSGGIASLERSVLALLHTTGSDPPQHQHDLVSRVYSNCVEDLLALTATEWAGWTRGEKCPLPIAATVADVVQASDAFVATAEQANVSLQKIICRPVFPATFNRAVADPNNKANLLSAETLTVVASLLQELAKGASPTGVPTGTNVRICCDKHGGRSRYLPLIQKFLTDDAVTIEIESRAVSRYRWQAGGNCFSIEFVAKGESMLPVAVASMVSKYVREVFMDVWNEFWIAELPDLKPTKGYPVDAKRFLADIAATQRRLGIPQQQIWRMK